MPDDEKPPPKKATQKKARKYIDQFSVLVALSVAVVFALLFWSHNFNQFTDNYIKRQSAINSLSIVISHQIMSLNYDMAVFTAQYLEEMEGVANIVVKDALGFIIYGKKEGKQNLESQSREWRNIKLYTNPQTEASTAIGEIDLLQNRFSGWPSIFQSIVVGLGVFLFLYFLIRLTLGWYVKSRVDIPGQQLRNAIAEFLRTGNIVSALPDNGSEIGYLFTEFESMQKRLLERNLNRESLEDYKDQLGEFVSTVQSNTDGGGVIGKVMRGRKLYISLYSSDGGKQYSNWPENSVGDIEHFLSLHDVTIGRVEALCQELSARFDLILNTSSIDETATSNEFVYEVELADLTIWLVRKMLLREGQTLVLGYDITEIRHHQSVTQQARKMEALKQLSARVAHDFNNSLSVIVGSIELSLAEDTIQEKPRNTLHVALHACQAARDSIRQIINYARNDPLSEDKIILDSFVENNISMLQLVAGPKVELNVESRTTATICVDSSGLNNTLVNLVKNATESILSSKPQGTIGIVIREANLRDLHQVPNRRDTQYVTIEVKDDGGGIDPEIAERIFEPYITAGKGQQGTGLGLASAYSFAAGSGGSIYIDGAKKKGACFNLCLPTANPDKECLGQKSAC